MESKEEQLLRESELRTDCEVWFDHASIAIHVEFTYGRHFCFHRMVETRDTPLDWRCDLHAARYKAGGLLYLHSFAPCSKLFNSIDFASFYKREMRRGAEIRASQSFEVSLMLQGSTNVLR
jgi:hypothetical protein